MGPGMKMRQNVQFTTIPLVVVGWLLMSSKTSLKNILLYLFLARINLFYYYLMVMAHSSISYRKLNHHQLHSSKYQACFAATWCWSLLSNESQMEKNLIVFLPWNLNTSCWERVPSNNLKDSQGQQNFFPLDTWFQTIRTMATWQKYCEGREMYNISWETCWWWWEHSNCCWSWDPSKGFTTSNSTSHSFPTFWEHQESSWSC